MTADVFGCIYQQLFSSLLSLQKSVPIPPVFFCPVLLSKSKFDGNNLQIRKLFQPIVLKICKILKLV